MYQRWETEDRYYEVYIEQDMLGDWIVTRVWGGRRNSLGQVRRTMVESHQAALDVLDDIAKTRKRHGYVKVGVD